LFDPSNANYKGKLNTSKLTSATYAFAELPTSVYMTSTNFPFSDTSKILNMHSMFKNTHHDYDIVTNFTGCT